MNTMRLKWTIAGLLSFGFVTGTTTLATGQVIRAISPIEGYTLEGNSSVTPDLLPIRIQHLFPASDFENLPETHRFILGYNFRADRSQTETIDWARGNETVWMSTTNTSSLTSVFDDNQGADKTLVFDGEIVFPLLGTGPSAGPRDIADATPFQTPFYYDPSEGNLLLERLVFGSIPPNPGTIDTQLTSQARSLVAYGVNSTVGDPSFQTIVAQIEFGVPCDFDGDNLCGASDLDLLLRNGRQQQTLEPYDLNNDRTVDDNDNQLWYSWASKLTGLELGPGDTNLDGIVNAIDLNNLGSNWQRSDALSIADGDLDGDGLVSATDLNEIGSNWLRGAPLAGSAVPEPSSAALLIIAAMACAFRRRR